MDVGESAKSKEVFDLVRNPAVLGTEAVTRLVGDPGPLAYVTLRR